MATRTTIVSGLLCAALLGAVIPATVTAAPSAQHGVKPAARPFVRADPNEVVLTTGVGAPGVYTVHVTITAPAAQSRLVRVLVGSVWHSTRAGGHHSKIQFSVALPVHGKTVTVRARSRYVKPRLSVRLTPDRNQSSATVTATAPAPAVVPAPAPAPAPAPTATTASVSGSGITLPAGFAPTANYTNLAKDYEFTGTALPADWTAGTGNYGFGATNFEPSQVSVSGGAANLTATNQASGGLPNSSGWISTQGHYSVSYGLIDFRAKMPAGQGLWSALWLDQANGSNPWGELDVQEMLLGNTHIVNGSLHGWAPSPQWHETQYTTMADDATQGYHDYQVVWQPGMVTWAVDGVAYAQYTAAQAAASGYPWPFDSQNGLYLVADLAVASPSEWGGPPNTSTAFPASMQIQSVKVWQ